MHVAVVGTGNVGRSIAFSILVSGVADELTLVDTKPGLARAVGEELRHAAAAFRLDTSIEWFERDEDLSGADLIVISAGYPRLPGQRISRRDLAGRNAEIIRYIAEVIPPHNRGARYVIVTNPVDAMATLFRRVSRESFIISTGDSLETQRFRAKLAADLGVPVSSVTGYVGGEHGENAVILWSTVAIDGAPLDEWLRPSSKSLDRESVESYVKSISRYIIEYSGATRFGPAATFTEIVKSIVLDERRIISVATPRRFPSIPEEVFVSVPTVVGRCLGPDLIGCLSREEVLGIEEAAKAIYRTYLNSLKAVGLEG